MKRVVIGLTIALALECSAALGAAGEATDPTVDAIFKSLGYLSAEQAKEFYERVNQAERTNALLAAGKAKGMPRTLEVDFLKPNEKNTIQLAANRISAIQVLDHNGKAWPIADFLPAPKNSLGVESLGATGSVLAVSPLVRYVRGNAILSLEDLETPISLSFETNEDVYDDPLTIKVRATYSPSGNAPAPTSAAQSTGYAPSNDYVQQFLDGLIPREAREVIVDAPFDVLVWRLGEDLIIKTEAELLYPGHRVRREKGSVRVFVVDPIEMLQFTHQGRDALIEVEY